MKKILMLVLLVGGLLALMGQAQPVPRRSLSASASLDFDLSAAGVTCHDLTITLSGAATGDAVALGLAAALADDTGVLFSAWVSAADTVTVRACDAIAGTLNPAAATVKATVIK